jgi:hypothetical protein
MTLDITHRKHSFIHKIITQRPKLETKEVGIMDGLE